MSLEGKKEPGVPDVNSLAGGDKPHPPVEPPPEPEKRKPPIRPPARNPRPKPIKDPPIPPAPDKDPHDEPSPIGDPPDKSDQPIRMNRGYGVLIPEGWRRAGDREHNQVQSEEDTINLPTPSTPIIERRTL